jgi:hypothetical protein
MDAHRVGGHGVQKPPALKRHRVRRQREYKVALVQVGTPEERAAAEARLAKVYAALAEG